MEYTLIFLLFSVLLFENIQSEKSNFLKNYEETVNTLVSNGLKGMKCIRFIERMSYFKDFFHFQIQNIANRSYRPQNTH